MSTAVSFGSTKLVVDEQLPPWSREAIEKIGQLGELKANWDSYGAHPVDPSCALAAIQLVLSYLGPSIPTPAIVPTNQGGIQLEWHRRRVDLEVAIVSPVQFIVTLEDEATGEELETVLTTDLEPLTPLLARIANED